MNEYHIKLLDPHEPHWMEFLSTRSNANIFHHPLWVNTIAECYGYQPNVMVVTTSDGTIIAGCPIMHVKSRLTGTRWVSLPFSDHCGPLYRDKDALDILTQGLVDLSTNQNPAERVELRWNYPSHKKLIAQEGHVLHVIPLKSNPDEVFSKFSNNVRRDIRSSIKQGLRVVWGDSIEHMRQFYSFQVMTRRRHGVPVQPWKYFKQVQENILSAGYGSILFAYQENVCMAGLVILYFNKTIVFKYPAYDHKYAPFHPNHSVYWDAIKWGCENGYHSVDWGRCENDNNDALLREFKMKWGAVETPLIYTSISSLAPELSGGKLMKGINFVLRNSPLWVTRLAGEALYKHIG